MRAKKSFASKMGLLFLALFKISFFPRAKLSLVLGEWVVWPGGGWVCQITAPPPPPPHPLWISTSLIVRPQGVGSGDGAGLWRSDPSARATVRRWPSDAAFTVAKPSPPRTVPFNDQSDILMDLRHRNKLLVCVAGGALACAWGGGREGCTLWGAIRGCAHD